MAFSYVLLIVIIPFIIGLVLLQIFLSKKHNKWLGLILPLIFLLISLMPIASVAIFFNATTEYVVLENGMTYQKAGGATVLNKNLPSLIGTIVYIFILYNIPTVILTAIYIACRERLKKRKEIQKMNIQDLE